MAENETGKTPEMQQEVPETDIPVQEEAAGEDAGKKKAKKKKESKPSEAEKLAAELAQEHDKYLRLYAEYDNYRKRSQKEREALYSDVKAGTIKELLPVYDNLARALKQGTEDAAFYKGVEMIMNQLMEILSKMGVSPIEAVGQPFDPAKHNAVMHVDDPELGESIVADEFEKGFIMGDKVIRFSVVKVAN